MKLKGTPVIDQCNKLGFWGNLEETLFLKH